MSATSPTATESPGSAPDNCETCQHPWAVHDAIGKRWCAASKLGVGARACLCVAVAPAARVLAHY